MVGDGPAIFGLDRADGAIGERVMHGCVQLVGIGREAIVTEIAQVFLRDYCDEVYSRVFSQALRVDIRRCAL